MGPGMTAVVNLDIGGGSILKLPSRVMYDPLMVSGLTFNLGLLRCCTHFPPFLRGSIMISKEQYSPDSNGWGQWLLMILSGVLSSRVNLSSIGILVLDTLVSS